MGGERGPYHLHVGHRPEAGHVDVRLDFCHGACGTQRGAGRGAGPPVRGHWRRSARAGACEARATLLLYRRFWGSIASLLPRLRDKPLLPGAAGALPLAAAGALPLALPHPPPPRRDGASPLPPNPGRSLLS